jgi:hypothetical protein
MGGYYDLAELRNLKIRRKRDTRNEKSRKQNRSFENNNDIVLPVSLNFLAINPSVSVM